MEVKQFRRILGGMMSFAWFIFDKNYHGTPVIDWV